MTASISTETMQLHKHALKRWSCFRIASKNNLSDDSYIKKVQNTQKIFVPAKYTPENMNIQDSNKPNYMNHKKYVYINTNTSFLNNFIVKCRVLQASANI